MSLKTFASKTFSGKTFACGTFTGVQGAVNPGPKRTFAQKTFAQRTFACVTFQGGGAGSQRRPTVVLDVLRFP